MKRDLFAAFKPKGTISKNDFDLTQKHVFSSRPGIIQPVCSIPVVPADYHEIDLTGIIRTMTMNTAAFVRGTWNFEAVFVPYTQLWHPFAQFITQRNDKHSSTQKGTAFCPVVSLKGLLILIRQSIAFYEYHFNVTHHNTPEMMLNNFPYVCDVHGYSWGHGALRLLDMLGYGDYSWIYQPELVSDFDFSYHVVDEGSFNAYLTRFNDKYVNVFALAAYQHSWYDLFRNKFYDEQTNINSQGVGNQSYVDFFNYDDIDCRSFGSSLICPTLLSSITTDIALESFIDDNEDEFYRLKGLLEIRYHQWKRDRFTSAMPSAQFGDVAKYTSDLIDLEGKIQNTSPSSSTGSSNAQVNNSSPHNLFYLSPDRDTWKYKVQTVVDVVAFRKAELLQQWKMNALRAGNMTDDAMEAHYGVTPYYTSDENVRHLGGWSTILKVEPVTATASTGPDFPNGSTGDLAAKGLSSDWQGSVVKCESRDFGCIQIYAYFLPEAEYAAEMIDKEHMRHEEFDFFTKEIENINLQPEVAISLSDNIIIPSGSSENDPLLATIGFNPPNVDLKTAIDKVHAGFYDKKIILPSLGNAEVNKAGTLSAWVAPKPTNFYRLQIAQGVLRPSLRNFYVNPNIYDKVMSLDMQSSNDYDNFVCNVLVVDRADRNLTVLGLPQY